MPQQTHHHHLTEIQFDGDPVTVIEREDGDHLVAMKPICEVLELDWEGQRQLINRDPVLGSTACIIQAVGQDGRLREMTCLPLQFLNGWLFKVDVSRYEGHRREKIIRYQRECYAALYQHFFRGRGRGRKYDPEMERVKRIEREIKIVNSIHRKQDTIHNAAKRISEGKATLEEYAGTPDLQDAIREKIDAMPDYRFGVRDYTTELAEDVLEWIKDRVLDGGFKRRKGVPVFSAREAYSRFSGRRGMKMRHMRPALQVLVEFGLINPLPAAQRKRGRPASQAYECTQKAIQEATAPVVPLSAHPGKKEPAQ
jgi:hypothetical protein